MVFRGKANRADYERNLIRNVYNVRARRLVRQRPSSENAVRNRFHEEREPCPEHAQEPEPFQQGPAGIFSGKLLSGNPKCHNILRYFRISALQMTGNPQMAA